MSINSAIKNLVYSNILQTERCKLSFVDNTVSVSSLLEIEKNRAIASSKHIHKALENESQYVDFSYFKKFWQGSKDSDSICMNIWFTKIGDIICSNPAFVSIGYCEGKLSLLHENMLKLELLKGKKDAEEVKRVDNAIKLFKNEVIEKNKDFLIEASHFGIANNYNKSVCLPTVSYEFAVDIDNQRLNLKILSELSEIKEFYLVHYHNWDNETVTKKYFNSCRIDGYFGPWKLITNIPGMKQILTKPIDKQNKIFYGVDALCDNLKVNYELLPKYLQEEVVKVKSLKK